MKGVVAIGVIVVAGVVVGRVPAQSPPRGDDPAVAAAKARAVAYDTVEATFEVRETVAVGAISSSSPLAPKGITTPERETVLESVFRIVLVGRKLRLENNHPVWAPAQGKALAVRLVNVADGELHRSLYPVGMSDPNVPDGYIHRSPDSRDIRSYILLPLTAYLRGADPKLTAYALGGFRPTGTPVKVGDRMCQEYSGAESKAEANRMWLDPEAGFVLRRFRTERGGRPAVQHDVTYRPDGSGGVVPEGWRHVRFAPDGQPQVTTDVRVTRLDRSPALPADVFELTFPPGARVYDTREDKTYTVQPDGRMREFSLATGEYRDETVYQPGTSWARQYWWVLVLGGGSIVALVVIARRQYRRPRL